MRSPTSTDTSTSGGERYRQRIACSETLTSRRFCPQATFADPTVLSARLLKLKNTETHTLLEKSQKHVAGKERDHARTHFERAWLIARADHCLPQLARSYDSRQPRAEIYMPRSSATRSNQPGSVSAALLRLALIPQRLTVPGPAETPTASRACEFLGVLICWNKPAVGPALCLSASRDAEAAETQRKAADSRRSTAFSVKLSSPSRTTTTGSCCVGLPVAESNSVEAFPRIHNPHTFKGH